MLNRFQIAVANSYANGEFKAMVQLQGEAMKAELANCGDGFFHFLMVELSTTEGTETVEEALQRLHSVQHQLNTVAFAIDALDGEGTQQTAEWTPDESPVF